MEKGKHFLFDSQVFEFIKRLREPNFCEPTSHIFREFMVHIFHSSQLSRKPVNIGSKVTTVLFIIPISKFKFELIQIKIDKIERSNFFY